MYSIFISQPCPEVAAARGESINNVDVDVEVAVSASLADFVEVERPSCVAPPLAVAEKEEEGVDVDASCGANSASPTPPS